MDDNFHDNKVIVCVYPEAGRLVVQRPHRRRDGLPDTASYRGRYRATSQAVACSRARTRMSDFAVANHLDAFVTLSYRNELTGGQAEHELRKLMKRFRRHCPGQPWVAVTERGAKNSRLHHHMMISSVVTRKEVVSLWDLGYIRYGFRPTAKDIRASAYYMAKRFDRPVTYHRYQISRHGIRPQMQRFEVDVDDLESFIDSVSVGDRERPWYLTHDQPWFDKIEFWEPGHFGQE